MNFAKNTIITFVTRFLKLIFAVGITMIIARILGAGGSGAYSLIVLLPTFLIVFTNFGIGSASVYFIGKKKYPLSQILGNSIIFSLIISFLALAVGLIVVFYFSDTLFQGVGKRYLLLGLSLIPFQIFLSFLENILLGLREIKKYNLITLIPIASFFILILSLFLNPSWGLTAVIASQFIGLVVSCLISFSWIRKLTNGTSFNFNKNYVKETLDYGFKTYLGGAFSFLSFRADIFLINLFTGTLAVGFYSVAVNISENIWLISKSAATMLFPEVASEERKSQWLTPIVCRNILLITAILALVLFLISKWLIVLLFTERFLNSVLPLRILLIGTIAISGSRIITSDLHGRGKPILSAYSNLSAIILNIILNLILIPKYGIIGAAWASAVSYSMAFLMNLVFYSAVSGNKMIDAVVVKKSDIRIYTKILSWIKKS